MPTPPRVLRPAANWRNLWFYRKADTLYQLTFVFCQRFLPAMGDRTVDQMVQAARSGKQNIVEGSEDGRTSTEMELKLLNVARSSIGELMEDYRDYVSKYNLVLWEPDHPRYEGLQAFTKAHNDAADYLPLCNKWTAEEFCNIALTLCHQVDKMMTTYLEKLEKQFVSEGGIKERMYAARSGYRQNVDEQLALLQQENAELKEENAELKKKNVQLKEEVHSLHGRLAEAKAKYDNLKQRAIKAYNDLKSQLDQTRSDKIEERNYRKKL